MINTNRLDYKKDLEEVQYMFSNEDLDITHFEKTEGDSFFNEFTLDGKEYTFFDTHETSNEIELKRMEKRFSKLGLYKILAEKYNVNFPWGALTGIRPVRMARVEGEGYKEILKNVFLVQDKKIDLVEKILAYQEGLYDIEGKYCDFYISIPFCPSRCEYCSFTSQVCSSKEQIDLYIDRLVDEINGSLKFIKKLRSIYIGGGTPVVLEEKNLIKVLDALSPIVSDGIEFTVEGGRPDAITKEKLEILKEYKVSRVCVNPQTFLDTTLQKIGRKHTVKDVYEKYNLTKSFGFDINMDLIAGLEGESLDDFKYSVNEAISLDPENITIHTLCLKKGAKLKEKVSRLQENDIYDMIDYSHETLWNNKYFPYYLYRQKYMAGNLENTGYTKKGKECIYNMDVMEETSNNIACGANSVSKRVFPVEDRIERYGSPKDIKTYINKVEEILRNKEELYK